MVAAAASAAAWGRGDDAAAAAAGCPLPPLPSSMGGGGRGGALERQSGFTRKSLNPKLNRTPHPQPYTKLYPPHQVGSLEKFLERTLMQPRPSLAKVQ